MAGFRFKFLAVLLLAAALMLAAPATAFAADAEQLAIAYTDALKGYENALDEQEQNAGEIEGLAREIERTEGSIGRAQSELGETAVAYYKGTRFQSVLVELVLGSTSFQDAVMRYDLYEKVERRCAARIDDLIDQRDDLAGQKAELEARKAEIEARVEEAKREAEQAERALLDATHSDGAQYHQVQGNGSNCGATSFIVGVNLLLHENRFTDNVAVWKGAGFNGDSTVNLAAKGKAWLLANHLNNEFDIEEVPGDVHKASELKELLDAGNVVIISSGPDSEWHLADGTTLEKGAHAEGHWVVFYRCEGGIFFCNDSSEVAAKGAGCPYTEEQMQKWLDGRSYHFATILSKK